MRRIKIKITYMYVQYIISKRKNTFIKLSTTPKLSLICILNCLILDAFYRNTDIDKQNTLYIRII